MRKTTKVFTIIMAMVICSIAPAVSGCAREAETSAASGTLAAEETASAKTAAAETNSADGEMISAEEETTEEAFEPEIITSGEYEYYINKEGTATIAGYLGTEDSITLPAELDGNKVTEIGEDAFSSCDALTVYVEEGSYAEQYCMDNEVAYDIIPEETSGTAEEPYNYLQVATRRSGLNIV